MWNDLRRTAAEAARLEREKEEVERLLLEEEALALMGERPHFLQRFVTWINADRDEKNLEATRLIVREELDLQRDATVWNDLLESEDVLPAGQYDELPIQEVTEVSEEEEEEHEMSLSHKVLFLRKDLADLKGYTERLILEFRKDPVDERDKLIVLATAHDVPLEAWWNRNKIRKEIERKLGL